MNRRNRGSVESEMDGLRLIALGRIPRCGDCPRYRALLAAERDEAVSAAPLPAIPAQCTWQVCAPLARRYEHAVHQPGNWALFAS